MAEPPDQKEVAEGTAKEGEQTLYSGHFTFSSRLQPKEHEYKMVQIMLDSGTTSNFISQWFVETYNIPLKKKARPIPLSVIDGTPISMKVITHQTIVCNLMLGSANEYHKMLTLDEILIVTYNIILGMP